ncbi:hypothetical protein AB0B94_30420 [Micromonospora sp. NPDC048986]|uniref:hypothetical protein n=1 Tax=Micromonospora sp. NPDC048986 TaxID=3155644 RepID=UPI003410ED6E
MTTTPIRFDQDANVDYRRTRAYYMASEAVICPTCKSGFGRQCQSTGGGNFAVVPTHKARLARIAGWSTEQRHTYGELVWQYRRTPWDAPAEVRAEAEAAAAPIPAKDTKQPTPKGVRLSENQAEEIERTAYNGGKTAAPTSHFHGDHHARQTIQALAAKGILAKGELTDDGYHREYTLTPFGWEVYRQHRLIIHRLSDEQIDAFIAQQSGGTGEDCDDHMPAADAVELAA